MKYELYCLLKTLMPALFAVTLTACSTFAPWERGGSGQFDHDLWTAPNQRAITWHKTWSCYSGTGKCHDAKRTDHKGRRLEIRNPEFPKYVSRHYWEQCLFREFEGHIMTYGKNLETQLSKWQTQLSLTNPDVEFYRVSYNPDVVIAVENQFFISVRKNWYRYENATIRGEEQLRELFYKHTPPEALIPGSSLVTPLLEQSLKDTIVFPATSKIKVLQDSPRGLIGKEVPSSRLPYMWWFRMDKPDEPPQLLTFENGKARIVLGDKDVINIMREQDQARAIRTTE